jgi:hypothetical protein
VKHLVILVSLLSFSLASEARLDKSLAPTRQLLSCYGIGDAIQSIVLTQTNGKGLNDELFLQMNMVFLSGRVETLNSHRLNGRIQDTRFTGIFTSPNSLNFGGAISDAALLTIEGREAIVAHQGHVYILQCTR